METTERRTPMLTLHRGGVYIPEGCDQQGRQQPGHVNPEDYEHSADMARRCCAADDEDADTLGEGAGVFIWPAVVLAVVGLVLLIAAAAA